MGISKNSEMMGCWIVVALKLSTRENGPLGSICSRLGALGLAGGTGLINAVCEAIAKKYLNHRPVPNELSTLSHLL